MSEIRWDIRREPRAWSPEEMDVRWPLTPEHFESIDGKLFFEDAQRLHLLAMLLENVGIDAAIQLAPAELWREALDQQRS
jgi:hypothetical protein